LTVIRLRDSAGSRCNRAAVWKDAPSALRDGQGAAARPLGSCASCAPRRSGRSCQASWRRAPGLRVTSWTLVSHRPVIWIILRFLKACRFHYVQRAS